MCGRPDGAYEIERCVRVWAEASSRALKDANERLAEQGRPPLPNTTPHTMGRTCISIALRANNFDVKRVMSQVGHANSTMTREVYAQLQQRATRRHGTAFDALLREAKRQRENGDWATRALRGRPPRSPEAQAGKKSL
jgi:integrase